MVDVYVYVKVSELSGGRKGLSNEYDAAVCYLVL